MRGLIKAIGVATLLALPSGGWAENLALIVANVGYKQLPDSPGTQKIKDLAPALRQAGFEVAIVSTNRAEATAPETAALWQRLEQADRLLLVFAGHIVATPGQTWLLHQEARDVTAMTAGQEGWPIEPFLGFAAARPGDAAVVLGVDPVALPLGFGVSNAVAQVNAPQGVTVIQGAPGAVAAFLGQSFLRPDLSRWDAARQAAPGVTVAGYLPRSAGFFTGSIAPPIPAVPVLTPEEQAKLAEEALRLTREQRRALQRALTLLGYDTRGVDGILGRNSRRAIAAWQRDAGFAASGYLSANQITRLQGQAKVRAEQLQRQAEERRRAAEAADRAYWQQTGAGSAPEGLVTYLQRYPDGLYAPEAQAKLQQIERQQRAQAQAAERQAWDQAQLQGTVAGFQAYLDAYPQGVFRDQAVLALNAMQNPEVAPGVVEAARQEEGRMGLTSFTRRLIEDRLRGLGLSPGPADGRFTDQTRQALRQFQRINDQPPTGYVTRNTIVLLLASAL